MIPAHTNTDPTPVSAPSPVAEMVALREENAALKQDIAELKRQLV